MTMRSSLPLACGAAGTVAAVVAVGVVSASCTNDIRAIERGVSPTSGAVALTGDDAHLLIAAEDHDALFVMETATRDVERSIPVPGAPTQVVLDEQGHAIVSARLGGAVYVVDVVQGAVLRRIEVGAEPTGLQVLAAHRVAVAVAGEQELAVVDTEAGTVVKTVALPDRDPRAVALLPDGDLVVAHMATGTLSRVDLDSGEASTVDARTHNSFGPRLSAEHFRSLTIDDTREGETHVLIAHSQATDDTMRESPTVHDDETIEPPPAGCGYCAVGDDTAIEHLSAVVPALTEVDTSSDSVVVPAMGPLDDGQALPPRAPPSVMGSKRALRGVALHNPAAVALVDGGRGRLVIPLGSREAALVRRTLDGTGRDLLAVAPIGAGASSVVVSHDGATAYVWNQFDATVSILELRAIDDSDATRPFVTNGAGGMPAFQELGIHGVPELPVSTVRVADDALAPDVSLGRRMFHDATDERLATGASISCAACHPDGRADGRTWQFRTGARNTPQLGGDILDTAPFHWPGDVATVEKLNDMTIMPLMGGSGLPDDEFGFLAAYLHTLRAAPSHVDVAGTLSAQQRRGKAIFESAATGCTTCHAGAHFTDNVSWDIGTRAEDRDIRAFQTPVLHGLSRSAPYFHDGRFNDLQALVRGSVLTDQMGHGSHLSDGDAQDLVAYLSTL